MLNDEISYRVQRHFAFTPTKQQGEALHTFAAFLTDNNPQSLMILRGNAGTGKTSLAGAMVRGLSSMGMKVMLLAPTGRAAKVFSANSGHPAYTIHHQIYRQKSFSGDGGVFDIGFNRHRNTLFMVDESSMIANHGAGDSSFGSGNLLDDLVSFVYAGNACRLMLIGDMAQLPPVGQPESPALSPHFMQGYGLQTYVADLDEVLRQSSQSGILFNATRIRELITRDSAALPRVVFRGFADIRQVPGSELIETLSNSYASVGLDETIVVTRSNKQAYRYNQGIRNMILDREEQLSTGEMLMVVRNNYFWVQDQSSDDANRPSSDNNPANGSGNLAFIANGDRAEVMRVRNIREVYGFKFADAWLRLPDYNDYELQATVILDSLDTEAPALTKEQNERLFNEVAADYADVPTKQERYKQMRKDRLLNAIQIKYAYAVTCHKAQGGQWSHVYVDQGYMTADMLSADYLHWLYTAFTRATERLYLVNWAESQTEVPGTQS